MKTKDQIQKSILEQLLQEVTKQKEKITSTRITNWILVAWLLFALIMTVLVFLKNQETQEQKYISVITFLIFFMLANNWYKKQILSKKGEIMQCLSLIKKRIKFGVPVYPKKNKLQNYEELMHQIAWDRYVDDEQYLTYLILSLIGWRSDMPNKFLSEIETLSEEERENYCKEIKELYEYFSKL